MNFFDYPIRGVDLSTYDGAVNWDVLNTKIQFAIPRIGYGRTLDAQFKPNWAGCKVVKQAYWYLDYYSNYNADSLSYGMTNAEWGRTQAQNAYNFVGEKVMTWLDIESAGASYSPAISTVWTRVQEIARAFLEKIDELNGLTNGIYCSLSLTKEFTAWFKTRPLWVAWYTRLKTPEQVKASVASNGWTGRVCFWQYASDGDTDADGDGDGKALGLTRNVGDLDIWLGTAEEWKEFTGGNVSVYPEKLVYPIDPATRISQKFGANPGWYPTSKGHNGVDWAAAVGTPVYAMQDGVVVIAEERKEKSGYGRQVRIQHNEGLSIYGHFSKLLVTKDQTVKAGQQIGLSGGNTDDPCSGFSTGPHLHAEYRLASGAPQVPGGYVYNAIDILPLLNADDEVPPLYRVRVTIPNLLIRSGAGANYPVVKRYASGEYDVFEEKNGYGRIGVNMWIALQYTSKIVTIPEEVTDSEKLSILWNWYKESHD